MISSTTNRCEFSAYWWRRLPRVFVCIGRTPTNRSTVEAETAGVVHAATDRFELFSNGW